MPNDPNLDPVLKAKLARLHLCLEAPDQDTLVVKRVPANGRVFTKSRTNLLVKRAGAQMPCLVCVDEDLEYAGSDPAIAQAFAAAPTQQGWRILAFGGKLRRDLADALGYAFAILEASGDSGHGSDSSGSERAGLLAHWARNLTRESAESQTGPTLFRDEKAEQAAGCALAWQGRMALITGEPGTGKTNLLSGVAKLIAPLGREVLAVNAGAIMAGTLFESEREALLASLLREAIESSVVLALDRAEWAMIGTHRSAVLLRDALDQGASLLATAAPEQLGRFTIDPLLPRLEIIQLKELSREDTLRVLALLCPAITTHHAITIDAEVVQTTVERSRALPGALPGKAIRLLDAAAARARLTGSRTTGMIDVYLAAARMLEN